MICFRVFKNLNQKIILNHLKIRLKLNNLKLKTQINSFLILKDLIHLSLQTRYLKQCNKLDIQKNHKNLKYRIH